MENYSIVDSLEGNSEELFRQNPCRGLDEDDPLRPSADAISVIPEDMDEDGCFVIHHMDIKEPLIKMKKALEESHGICLDGYQFYLQDSQMLEGHKNLVEQCVQGCGTVQVNLQIKIDTGGTKKINIVDVLKPSDSYLKATGQPAFSTDTPVDRKNHDQEPSEEPDRSVNTDRPAAPAKSEPLQEDSAEIRWVVDQQFRASQQKLQIPQDPMDWNSAQVRHWLLWAVRRFNLKGINISDWNITGAKLCSLTLEDFKERVPNDLDDVFWTHIELLRRCKFVAVMQNSENLPNPEDEEEEKKAIECQTFIRNREKRKLGDYDGKKVVLMEQNTITTNSSLAWGNRTGNNGQVQLWQFLLDLLTDKNHRNCIQWLGAEGEFKLLLPDRVAQLWGLRKNKPNMNYEKLSRALRYYYDGDMISKVPGKRFVYKFVCDLKQLLGYSAFELNRLVIEAEMRAVNSRLNDPSQHAIYVRR